MRLSDFQTPVVPKVPAVMNWKKTRVTATEGANAPYISLLMDDDPTEFTESNGEVGEAISAGEGFANVAKQVVGGAAQNIASAAMMESDKSHSALRKKIHDALDKMLDAEAERNAEQDPDPNYPLHDPNAELDADDEEPEETDSDEEPEEETDSAMDAFHSFVRMFMKDAAFKTLATRKRPAVVDRDAATVVSSRREVTHNTGYLTDAAFIAQHLNPNMSCLEAAKKLSETSYKRQADDANRGYWSGLFFFLKSQPEGARIKDIENQACLSSLLMRTVGGMRGAFGV